MCLGRKAKGEAAKRLSPYRKGGGEKSSGQGKNERRERPMERRGGSMLQCPTPPEEGVGERNVNQRRGSADANKDTKNGRGHTPWE